MAIEVYQRDWAPSLSLSHPPKNDGITLEVGKLNLGSPFEVKAIALSHRQPTAVLPSRHPRPNTIGLRHNMSPSLASA